MRRRVHSLLLWALVLQILVNTVNLSYALSTFLPQDFVVSETPLEEVEVIMLDESGQPARLKHSPQITRRSIEKSMAVADDAAVHISKRAIQMEMLKLEPDFDKKLALDAKQALPFAATQSVGPKASEQLLEKAQSQAAPVGLSRKEKALSESRSQPAPLSPGDGREAAEQAKIPTEMEAEKHFESTLSASDAAATHVSKQELQQMIQQISSGMQQSEPMKKKKAVPPNPTVIPTPAISKLAAQQARGVGLSTAASQAASRQAQPLPVQTSAAAKQSTAPLLSPGETHFAESQAISPLLKPAAKRAAKQASLSQLTAEQEMYAVEQSHLTTERRDNAQAQLQSETPRLRPSELQQARLQASQHILAPKASMQAADQSSAPVLGLHSQARARAQSKQTPLSHAQEEEATIQSEDFMLKAHTEATAANQAESSLRKKSAAFARAQVRGPTLGLKQKAAAAQQTEMRESSQQMHTAAQQAQQMQLSSSGMQAAAEQSILPDLSTTDEQESALQARGSPLRVHEELLAKRQATDDISAHEQRQAVLQSHMQIPKANLGEALHQATPGKLSQNDKFYATQQSQEQYKSQDADFARDQVKQTLAARDKNIAADQATQTMTVQTVALAREQAQDSLSPSNEARAMVQATDTILNHDQSTKAEDQASGDKYTDKIKHQAGVQSVDPVTRQELLVAQEQSHIDLSSQDGVKAQKQMQQDTLSADAKKEAKEQARRPRLSKVKSDASRQASEPKYKGEISQFAQQQVRQDRLDQTSAKLAWKQASDRMTHRDAEMAREQVHSQRTRKNMAFAAAQSKKLYGAANQQAVDTISKLTPEKRLKALDQVDDSLKKADATLAIKQAAAIRITNKDKTFAKHQIFDKKISTLRKTDAHYAARQTVSKFDGQISREDKNLARKQAIQAEQKRQKFLKGYAAWNEQQKRNRIKEKYANQLKRHQDKRPADLGESSETNARSRVPSQLKVLPWKQYFSKLKTIHDGASKEIRRVRLIALHNLKNKS